MAPGTWPSLPRRRSITRSTGSLRSSIDLSETNTRPVFVVFWLPPMKATTSVTAGSAFTMLTKSAIYMRVAGEEMSCSAWMLPMSRPVSCCGKKPLGTTTNR